MKRILIIDDDMDMCNLLGRFLQKKGFETDASHSGNKGIAKFKESKFDVVLCDFRLGDKEGREVLKELKQIDPYAIVIIITGYSDIKTAVDVIKSGAFDYITKPLIPEEVLNVIGRALQQSPESTDSPRPVAATSSIRKNGKQTADEEFLVGQAPATRELYRQVQLVAPTNYSIILYGESGTGKEVIARTVHLNSARKDKPFVAMDCGTLSKELAGSELFGHVKGAFTGAL
ncbi:MAG TPA: sigma 54-interacting transcriptional regulator, partial [Puia sp.]|nr:sigma 54-interacting transcriptional regulator [Puia sp.]